MCIGCFIIWQCVEFVIFDEGSCCWPKQIKVGLIDFLCCNQKHTPQVVLNYIMFIHLDLAQAASMDLSYVSVPFSACVHEEKYDTLNLAPQTKFQAGAFWHIPPVCTAVHVTIHLWCITWKCRINVRVFTYLHVVTQTRQPDPLQPSLQLGWCQTCVIYTERACTLRQVTYKHS